MTMHTQVLTGDRASTALAGRIERACGTPAMTDESGYLASTHFVDAGGLGNEALQALAALGTIRTFRRHTIIVTEGDANESFNIVLAGRVKLFVSDEHGREIVVGTQGAGEYFGEALLDYGPACASVMTLCACSIAVVPKARFMQFLSQHPPVATIIMQKLVARVRALTQSVKSLALCDVQARVTRLLAELSVREGDALILRRMSQQEIASRVGASREMVSRVMKDLRARGYVSVDKQYVRILKRSLLRR